MLQMIKGNRPPSVYSSTQTQIEVHACRTNWKEIENKKTVKMTRNIPLQFVTLVVKRFSLRYLSLCLVGGILWIIFGLSYTSSTSFQFHMVHNLPPEAKAKARLLIDSKPVVAKPELNETKFFLVILVLAAPANFKQRMSIRKTWANQRLQMMNPNATSRTVFLIGQSNLTAKINQEHKVYNDILLGSFQDGYKRLVSKVHMGINWALSSTKFEYLVKCDDDVYVNIPRMIKWLQRKKLPRDFYGGFIHHNVRPVRKKYKNALRKTDYPGDILPPYAAGPAYILSRSAVTSVVNASHFVKPFFVEDAFMGCLAYHSGITPIQVDGFLLHFSSSYSTSDICKLSGVYVIGHNVNISHMTKLHSDVLAIESLGINNVNRLCYQQLEVFVCTPNILTVVAVTTVVVMFVVFACIHRPR